VQLGAGVDTELEWVHTTRGPGGGGCDRSLAAAGPFVVDGAGEPSGCVQGQGSMLRDRGVCSGMRGADTT
jgi:hypothetical protein